MPPPMVMYESTKTVQNFPGKSFFNVHYSCFRVRHLPVEDFIDCILPAPIEREISGSRLQLVLLSPTLLQVLTRHSNAPVGRLLHPDRVIAIMLGMLSN